MNAGRAVRNAVAALLRGQRVLQAARDWAPEPQDDMTVVAVLRRAEA